MVSYLLKPEGSEDFQQIVYFLNTSHIKYALTEKPTIHVSLIQQFWQTASVSTFENGEMEITATIDGRVKTVTKASIRRHLKTYIAPTLTYKLFSNMRRASKGYIGVDIPLFPTMLVQGPNLQGQGSTVQSDSHHINTSALFTSQPPTSPPSMQTTYIAEEAAILPHDSPLLRVYSLGSDKGGMTLHELMVLCTTLSKKVESLETDLKQTKLTYGAAFTKLIIKVKRLEKEVKLNKARRRAKIVVSDDEDAKKILPNRGGGRFEDETDTQILVDVAIVHTYSRRRRTVSTGSGGISTARESVSTVGASMPVSTAGMDQESIPSPSASKDKFATDEDLVQQLQAGEKYSEEDLPMTLVELVNQRKKFFAQQRAEAKRNKPMTYAQQKAYMVGDHTEAYQTFDDMLKKFDRDDLDKLWSLVKERFSSTNPTDEKERILWIELKRLFKPDIDDILWKLQRYMHDLLTWRLYNTCGVHHVSTDRGHDIFMLVEKDYPLTRGLMTDVG
ncbi:hypothetical protein Tco_0415664 [Tanacetum coccineum]